MGIDIFYVIHNTQTKQHAEQKICPNPPKKPTTTKSSQLLMSHAFKNINKNSYFKVTMSLHYHPSKDVSDFFKKRKKNSIKKMTIQSGMHQNKDNRILNRV